MEDEIDEEEPPRKIRKEQGASPKKKKSKEGKKSLEPTTPNGAGKPTDRSIELRGLSLDEAVQQGDGLVELAVKEWAKRYRENRSSAVAEVLSLVNVFCGCPAKVTVEQVREGDTDSLVKNLVDMVVEDGGEDLFVGSAKEKRALRSNFLEFWDQLARQAFAMGVVSDRYLVDKILDHVVGMSGAIVRNFRQVATLAGVQLCTSFIKCCLSLENSLEISRKQFNAEVRKKNKSNSSSISSLEKTIEELQKKLSGIQFYLKDTYTRIFAVRYRDRDEVTRSTCVEGLGHWIKLYPKEYLKDEYVKYLGWSVTDKDAGVRSCALDALSALFEDEENFTSLELFTSNFKDRFVELIMDVDNQVSAKAVQMLTRLIQLEALEAEEVSPVYDLLLEESAPLRKAASHLVHAVLVQNVAATTSKHGKGKDEGDGSVNAELKCIVDLLVEQGNDSTVATYFVDGLFEKCESMVQWDTMSAALLCEDESTKFTEEQATAMLFLMAACARKATGIQLVGKEAGQRKSAAKNQKESWRSNKEALTVSMIKNLPNIIRQHQVDVEKIPPMMQVLQTLDLDMFSLKRQGKVFYTLINLAKESLLKHTAVDSISACVGALLYCMREAPGDLKSECTQLVAECSVDLLSKVTKYSDELLAMKDEELHVDEPGVFAFYSSTVRLYELQHQGYNLHAMEEAKCCFDKLGKVLLDAAEGRPYMDQITQYVVVNILDQLLWRLRGMSLESAESRSMNNLKSDCEQFIASLESILGSNASLDLKDTCYRALTDVLLLFSIEKHRGTFLEPVGTQPLECTVKAVWKHCLSALERHRSQVSAEEEVSIEDIQKCTESLLACTRLLVFDAVLDQDWLLVETLRSLTWVTQAAEDVIKHICQAMKRTNPDRLWSACFGALEAAFDDYQSCSKKEKKRKKEELAHLIHFVNTQYRTFGTSKPSIFKVLDRGIKFAVSDGTRRVEYLEHALVYFASKVLPTEAKDLLQVMEQCVEGRDPSPNSKAWKSFIALKEYLVEKSQEAANAPAALENNTDTPQPRKISFANEYTASPADTRSEQEHDAFDKEVRQHPVQESGSKRPSLSLAHRKLEMPSESLDTAADEEQPSHFEVSKRLHEDAGSEEDPPEPAPRHRRRRIR